MGPPAGLEQDSEVNLVLYVDYCKRMGIPKTQDMLADEILHFLKSRSLTNKFRKGKPGTNICTEFQYECI